jgi:hypothetical protein
MEARAAVKSPKTMLRDLYPLAAAGRRTDDWLRLGDGARVRIGMLVYDRTAPGATSPGSRRMAIARYPAARSVRRQNRERTTMTNKQTHWKIRVINLTHGTQSGAILRYILGHSNDECPRFEGKASITSDGFVMCNFVDKDGNRHMGAFVGDAEGLDSTHKNVVSHFKLTEEEADRLSTAIDGWVGKDWR